MCTFIVATLPKSTDPQRAALLFTRNGLAFELISNPHVAAQIAPGTLQIITTRKCDCGTALGGHNPPDTPSETNWARKIRELKKRGWSEARITRWRNEKQHALEASAAAAEQLALQSSREIDRWISLISEIIESHTATDLGLFLHEYRGDIETERILLQGTRTIGYRNLTPALLSKLQEDVLYVFRCKDL